MNNRLFSPLFHILVIVFLTIGSAYAYKPTTTGNRSLDLINQVRREAKETATTEDNLLDRYKALTKWALLLRTKKVDFSQAYSRRDAKILRNVIRTGHWDVACNLVDIAFKNLELLTSQYNR